VKKYAPCPCDSKQLYHKCCKQYHDGSALPDTAEKLMRSRYCAYALGLVDYVMDTTHPENPAFNRDRDAWSADLRLFCEATKFQSLRIEATEDDAQTEVAFVTFRAGLMQGSADASFTERSKFAKVNGKWLYHSGEISDG
jgi:SEC-C motif-containing protein